MDVRFNTEKNNVYHTYKLPNVTCASFVANWLDCCMDLQSNINLKIMENI